MNDEQLDKLIEAIDDAVPAGIATELNRHSDRLAGAIYRMADAIDKVSGSIYLGCLLLAVATLMHCFGTML